MTSTKTKAEKLKQDPNRPRWGMRCMACQQRIKPFTGRAAIREGIGKDAKVLGWTHPGCLLRGSKDNGTAREARRRLRQREA